MLVSVRHCINTKILSYIRKLLGNEGEETIADISDKLSVKCKIYYRLCLFTFSVYRTN